MTQIYTVTTKVGQVIPIYLHESAGYVWTRPDGRKTNYAIPHKMKTSLDRLTFQVQQMYPGAIIAAV